MVLKLAFFAALRFDPCQSAVHIDHWSASGAIWGDLVPSVDGMWNRNCV